MINIGKWQATKIMLRDNGSLLIPGSKDALFPGSILIATLVARWYATYLPKFVIGTLLELGCGKLPYYQLYRQYIYNIICTDWPQTLHGINFADFISDLNDGIPLSDACVDTIIASDVLEHIMKPYTLFAEMNRVLKDGGIAFINMPFMYWVHEAPYDYYRYTSYAVRRMALEAGFDILVLDSVGGPFVVLSDILGKVIQRVPVIGSIVATTFQRFCLIFLKKSPRSLTYPLFVGAILIKRISSS